MAIEFSLNKKLGRFSLDLQGKFEKGITGVFGKSGSGKTTLLHCLSGFLKPDAGEIILNGKAVFSTGKGLNCPPEKRRLGMVFQDSLLFPHLTVRENIGYGLKGKLDKKKRDELLDLLDLYRLLERRPEFLSGGERQRVALARALVRQPDILLMDEPVSSVDMETRGQILVYLKKLHSCLKIPFVYVSHSISEIIFLTDQVLVIDQGKSFASGATLETLSNQNVWHLSDPVSLENIFELPVVEFRMAENLAVLDWNGTSLKVAYLSKQIKPALRIRLRARDIIVSKSAVTGLSARNIIAVRLKRIIPVGGEVVLQTVINGQVCLVEITASALKELEIREGETIYLIIKAQSIGVLES